MSWVIDSPLLKRQKNSHTGAVISKLICQYFGDINIGTGQVILTYIQIFSLAKLRLGILMSFKGSMHLGEIRNSPSGCDQRSVSIDQCAQL